MNIYGHLSASSLDGPLAFVLMRVLTKGMYHFRRSTPYKLIVAEIA